MLRQSEAVLSPQRKAKQLLCEVLPEKARQQFLEKDFLEYIGKIGVYRIFRNSQTEIYQNGRLAALSCLQLTIFAPSYDRMTAEYLILSNDEPLYWTKANIFPVRCRIGLRHVAVALFDVALIAKLVLDYLN